MNEREQMINALNRTFVPCLRELNFSGSFPHFRRVCENGRVDLLSIAFDKWGGAFYIEVSFVLFGKEWTNVYYPTIRTMEDVKKITVWNTHRRYRIKSGKKETWFYYCDLYEEDTKLPSFKKAKALYSVTQGTKDQFVTDKMKLIKKVDESIYETTALLAKEKMDQAFEWWKKHPTFWEKHSHNKPQKAP
jgi:hypothetical protein